MALSVAMIVNAILEKVMLNRIKQWLAYLIRSYIARTHPGPIVYENSGGVQVDPVPDQPSVRQTPAVKQR